MAGRRYEEPERGMRDWRSLDTRSTHRERDPRDSLNRHPRDPRAMELDEDVQESSDLRSRDGRAMPRERDTRDFLDRNPRDGRAAQRGRDPRESSDPRFYRVPDQASD